VVTLLSLLVLLPGTGCVNASGLTAPPESLIYPPEPPASEGPVLGTDEAEAAEGKDPEPESAEDMRERFAKAFAENARDTRALNWKTRTRLQTDGQVSLILEHRVRHDANGDRYRDLLYSGCPSSTRSGGTVPESDEASGEITETISQLVTAYTVPAAGMMERFLREASEDASDTTEPGTRCLAGEGFLMPEDRVRVWASPRTGQLKRMRFEALLEGQPVTGVVQYRNLPDGPYYPAHTLVRMPGRATQMTVEHYGYSLRR
jgi:hypothetical protein